MVGQLYPAVSFQAWTGGRAKVRVDFDPRGVKGPSGSLTEEETGKRVGSREDERRRLMRKKVREKPCRYHCV